MITFRKATELDIAIIRDIAEKTWPSTYAEIISQHQIEFMLDQMYNKGVLLEQMMGGCVFLIANKNGKDVGFMSYEMTDSTVSSYKLHKLYLLPEAQGDGTGKIMLYEVFSQVQHLGGKLLQLNVNKQNSAVHFYERIGFQKKEAVTIDIGNGFVMDDYVMEIPIPPLS